MKNTRRQFQLIVLNTSNSNTKNLPKKRVMNTFVIINLRRNETTFYFEMNINVLKISATSGEEGTNGSVRSWMIIFSLNQKMC